MVIDVRLNETFLLKINREIISYGADFTCDDRLTLLREPLSCIVIREHRHQYQLNSNLCKKEKYFRKFKYVIFLFFNHCRREYF